MAASGTGAAGAAAIGLPAAVPLQSIVTDSRDAHLTFDLGLMAAFDPQPVDPTLWAAGTEVALTKTARANTQALITRIFELPIESTDVGPVVSRARFA